MTRGSAKYRTDWFDRARQRVRTRAARAIAVLAFVAAPVCAVAQSEQSIAIQDWPGAGVTTAPVLAELDFTTQLTVSEDGESVFVLPLLAAPVDGIAQDPANVLGALIHPGVITLDDSRLDPLLEDTLSIGDYGPVVRLNMTLSENQAYRDALDSALASEGRTLSATAPILVPVKPSIFSSTPVMQGLAAVAAALALLVMTLTMRILARPAVRAKAAGVHHRVAPYVPAMATGENGAQALRLVIGGEQVQEPTVQIYRANLAPKETVTPRPVAKSAKPLPDRAAKPFPDLPPDAYPNRRKDGRPGPNAKAEPAGALLAAMHFGPGRSKETPLTKRAISRADSDPFVQRLGKLN